MPNVLILGGSGYVGLALAKSLLQSGTHAVWGTARSAEKTKSLLANDIIPVEDNITDPVTLSNVINQNNINVVVDATSAYEQAGEILNGVVQAATSRQNALATEKLIGPKLGFVYTSSSWVHGTPATRLNDLAPVGSKLSQDKPATAVAWRPAHEQAILAARDKLDVAILRPHAIYGRGSWVWGTWWGGLADVAKSGSTAPVQVPADIKARTGVAHVDDVASAFHAAIDRIDGRPGAWPVFDLVTEVLSVVEIMEAAKTFLGVNAPLDYTGTHCNPFLEALSLVNKSDSSRAKVALGWDPRRTEFLLNLPIYWKPWQAAQ